MNKYKKESIAAQKKRKVEKRCLNKKVFPSRKAAHKQQPKQEAYKCLHCGKWHLSNSLNVTIKTVRNKGKI